VSTDPDDTGDPDGSTVLNSADSGNGGVVQPTGVGRRAGEPSPDDRAALPDDRDSTEDRHGTDGDGETRDDNEPTGAGQTTLSGFSS
jgi:hypothetical protein